jgi:hypothetical protein
MITVRKFVGDAVIDPRSLGSGDIQGRVAESEDESVDRLGTCLASVWHRWMLGFEKAHS